jgi:hypothetical protein
VHGNILQRHRRRGGEKPTRAVGSAEAYGKLKVTITASTGAKIVVWREDDLFHARLSDTTERSQVCLAVDLFEVVADLAGLDLDDEAQAAEAIALAEDAQRRLPLASGPPFVGGDNDTPSARCDTGT